MKDRRDDKTKALTREERLRQALRANLARRKDQARARADQTDTTADPDGDGKTSKDS